MGKNKKVILGISGIESIGQAEKSSHYQYNHQSIKNSLTFNGSRIPIQFCPLHLMGHDSSAALIVNGKLVAFAAEERFSRIKHGYNLAGNTVLPRRAIAYCLKEASISWDQIDHIAHYCHFTELSIKNRLDRMRKYLDSSSYSRLADEYWTAYENRLSKSVLLQHLSNMIKAQFLSSRLIQVGHHLAHGAGAYYSSEFHEALIVTMDGYGEEESVSWAIGKNKAIHSKDSIHLPSSLGILYQIITAYLGFRTFGDEYKVMGLASYGNSHVYNSVFQELVKLLPDGKHTTEHLLNADLYLFLKDSFGDVSQGTFSQKAADIAASLQTRLETAVLHLLSHLRNKYPIKNLCLSGGVALNASMNGKIMKSGLFDHVFIQPAGSDDGASLGAAFYALYQIYDCHRKHSVFHVYWGPGFQSCEVESAINKFNNHIQWKQSSHIEELTSDLLIDKKLIGWFQGRTEMGPRALGARSILADPRYIELREQLNQKIKHRECFRPFAPSVLQEEAWRFFDITPSFSSPFMTIVVPVRRRYRQKISGVIHVDGSSRIQTVLKKDNPIYYRLLRVFFEKTGFPLLLNTSFNRAGEPIVNSPEDAIRCFLKTGLDALIINNYILFQNKSYQGL